MGKASGSRPGEVSFLVLRTGSRGHGRENIWLPVGVSGKKPGDFRVHRRIYRKGKTIGLAGGYFRTPSFFFTSTASRVGIPRT
jgi:hypothetical protein